MILADTSEPDSIVSLIRQGVPVTVSPLNQNKIADYFFGTYEGRRVQFNRVQAGELVGDVDSMEDELRRYYDSADESNQIIEGLLSPVKLYMKGAAAEVHDHSRDGRSGGGTGSRPSVGSLSTRDLGGRVFTYPIQPSGFIDRGHSFTTVRMSELYAWIYRLGQLGVHTYYTNNWEETARFLMTVYRNEQKPPDSHTTFKRIYRPKVYIKTEKDMTPNELVEHKFIKSLLFLSSAYQLGIGEVKARAIASSFCNILDLATASLGELAAVEGIGTRQAGKILESLGRDI